MTMLIAASMLAASPLPVGTALVAVPTAIAKGDRLTLVSRVGPISIERPVTAMQAVRPHDRRVFVRTDDGDVFAAPIGAIRGAAQ